MEKVMGMGTIIAIVVATGVVSGVLIGILSGVFGVGQTGAGVGVSMGVVGAILLSRRKAALEKQKKGDGS